MDRPISLDILNHPLFATAPYHDHEDPLDRVLAYVDFRRTLLQGAELVVLDESFASLDPETMGVAVRCVLQHAPSLIVVCHP